MKLKHILQAGALSIGLALAPKPAKANADNLEKKVLIHKLPKNKPILKKKKKRAFDIIRLPPKKKTIYSTKWWEYGLYIPLAYVATIGLHESGHFTLAHLFGFKDIKMHGPNLKEKLVSSVSYMPNEQYRNSKLEQDLLSGAGVAFTTIGNLTLTSLLRYDSIPDKLRPFIATTSLMMMTDRWRYIFSGAIQHAFKIKMADSHDINSMVTNHVKSRKWQNVTYAALALGTALEAYLRKNEIQYLFNVIAGKKVKVEKGRQMYMMSNPIKQGFMVNIGGQF
ncbi:MAG: hypothetical protein U9Q69_00320 [Nanoarchaeota archaeon]|nr:hypothetical protein [Nanoarchaeota archaeon]